MPKGSKSGAKSSASAGTRKKNARKAAKDEDEDGQPQQRRPQRGQKKGPDGKKMSKAQRRAMPKAKQYIPPPKPPAPPIPDPLDAQGLARTLPAELVVVLRRLGKKDDVTRRKALDELRENWVAPMLQTGGTEDEQVQRDINAAAVESALPVWMHNLASLLQSPFHRSQAITLHDDMLAIPQLRSVILDTLSMSYLPGTQERDIIGSWLVAAIEEGRRGGRPLQVWESVTRFGRADAGGDAQAVSDDAQTPQLDLTPHLSSLAEYLSLSILDPETLHRDIHPPPVQAAFSQPQPPAKGGKGKQMAKARASPIPTPTPPVEESEECKEERMARYCVGGLVGLSWLVTKLPAAGFTAPPSQIAQLLNNPVLWSAMGTTIVDPDIVPIGIQPPTRRGAYLLLTSLLEAYPAQVEEPELLRVISSTLLANCWSEKEAVVWEAAGTAVVRFLTKYRQCWEIAAKEQRQKPSQSQDKEDEGEDEDEDEGDEDDDDEDEDEDRAETEPASRDDNATPAPAEASPADDGRTESSSFAFNAFLDFVSTICPSIPHLTYPLLVVVVSTMPVSILPLTSPPSLPLQNLFSHLWSPVDARLLSTHTLGNQLSAFQTFLQSASDITVYLLEKSHANEQDLAEWLVKEQLGIRLWDQGVIQMGGKGGRRGTTPPETEAKIAAKTAAKLNAMSAELVAVLMAEVDRTTVHAAFDTDEKRNKFLPRALNALTAFREAGSEVEIGVDSIIVKIANGCTERLFEHVTEETTSTSTYAEALVDILRKRKDLFTSDKVEVLSQGLQAHVSELADALPPTLVAALFDSTVAIASEAESKTLLAALWDWIKSSDVDQAKRFALARGIIESKSSSLLYQDSLDYVGVEAARAALTGNNDTALLIASSAAPSSEWLSSNARSRVLSSVCASVHDAVDNLLTVGAESVLPLESLSILKAYAQTGLESLVASDEYVLALVAVHHLVLLGPKLDDGISVPASATEIWTGTASLPADSKRVLSAAVSRSLAELLGRVSCRADPDTLVDVALMTDLGEAPTPADVAATMLPAVEDILSQLSEHTSRPPHPAMATIDPLVPYVSDPVDTSALSANFDAAGRSRAARYAEAGLALQRVDRSLVSSLPYLLNVALSAMVLAGDGVAIPGASRGLYTPDASTANLEQVVRDAAGALSFSLTLVDEAPLAWHKATVEQLKAGTASAQADYLQRLLTDLRGEVAERQSDVPVRAFRAVLTRHLRRCEAGEAEGEVWLNYAMSLIDKLPELAHAIILSIKPFMIDTKPFATAQNRLANSLTGITVKAANDKGLPAMRLLIASAPDPDSASMFIPQQRALFVLKHVGGWLTSDDEAADEFSDEIDVRVAELYTALAPIVQDMSGSHWDQIFDLIDGALGSCQLDDPVSYPLLHAGLLLLKEVRDLCASNKSLRELWTAKDEHLSLVVKLFVQCRDADSVPLQLIHALILDLLFDASDRVMAAAGLPELCDLLRLSSSATIQATAYRLLSQVIKAQTKALVLEVEAAVVEDEAPARTITLPEELIAIVDAGRGVDWDDVATIPIVTTQLLAWMAILDHFDDASRTLRWAYLDQMNSSRLLEEALLPLLFAMLGVSEVGAWNFPASAYAVDEFFPDLLEPEVLPDLVPLGSHIYYRTLVTIPSAMRAYYESLKDRQLSLSLLAFTARHYSPVIIQHEFAALREPRALATLTDEGLSVRIAQGGGAAIAGASSAEAIASYVVDEQPMEIGIRLPAEFPLKAVDVRDLRRVGVPENKWRGWLMGVQQTITSRNGLILEALTVFKKNVALHFDGVVECAICYSIISLTDRTLPTKPCRTCKNRFHASCLFKWFNSSHTSSCPLCRSLF